MNTKIPLYQPPCSSTSFINVAFLAPKSEISYQYYDENNKLCRETIRFQHIRALEWRTEKTCTIWHVENTYDTLCEVSESSWLKKINQDTDEFWRDKWQMRHFIIYLEDIGCLEIIAENWLHHIEEIPNE